VVAPIAERHTDYARSVAERLRSNRARVEVDERSERLSRKIRDARNRRVPYIAVVGDDEASAGMVKLNVRGGEQVSRSIDDFSSQLRDEIASRRLAP
jgi:threonyl-tRNA synthetase